MSSLELLREIARLSEPGDDGELPPNCVRFTLEYGAPPEAVAARVRVTTLLQSDSFSFQPLAEGMEDFWVLQFLGVERSISTPSLYAMAATLADELDLVSCAPDTGATFYEEATPDDRAAEAVVADPLLDITCWVQGGEPNDRHWAPKLIKADRVWARGVRGEGVLVGQPDTGVADHTELAGALRMDLAFDVMRNKPGATDPLRAGSGNPGHGTATASVVASREDGQISGVAPAAQVVPIRCIESVIIAIDAAPVARAVAHATKAGVQVITMSLGGGFFSPALHAAIKRAVERDIIVCAAAGNCIQPIVVYPAADPNVIAVAGVGPGKKPWKGTSHGRKIDIAAPAEHVYHAQREPGDASTGAIHAGQGTSFATAAVAGVAALWLSHFGVEAVRAEAAKRGVPVHHLFRAAIRKTAQRPTGWDAAKFGAGIINAEALVDLQLADIPPVTLPAPRGLIEASPEVSANRVMEASAARRDDGFSWSRHGPEAAYLALDAWLRTQPAHSLRAESHRRPRASGALYASAPPVLRRALARAENQPALQPPASGLETRDVLRLLGAAAHGGGLEAAGLSPEAARGHLTKNAGALREAAEDVFARLNERDGDPRLAELRRSVIESVEPAVARLVAEAPITTSDRIVLEALVSLKDRPALRVKDGDVDPLDPQAGEWGGALAATPELSRFCKSVGRVDIDGEHMGTGFVVAPGVLLTNRHVLEGIAEEVRARGTSKWHFSVGSPTVDFDDEADGSLRFRITEVIATGPTPTGGKVKFSTLDAALLAFETTNAEGRAAPKPLPMVNDQGKAALGSTVLLFGYPARPSTSSMLDPNTGQFSPEVAKRLGEIYGVSYGVKYVSPGRIKYGLGALSDDPRDWVFGHDATTLGGNSGSMVVHLGAPFGILGLHFGGATLTANYAHSLSTVSEKALKALRGPGFAWI